MTHIDSTPAEIFRKGLAQYVADLAQANANLAAKHAKTNQTLPTLSLKSPVFHTASLQDMLYWANGVEHYKFVGERRSHE